MSQFDYDKARRRLKLKRPRSKRTASLAVEWLKQRAKEAR